MRTLARRSTNGGRTGTLIALLALGAGFWACQDNQPWGPTELRITEITLGSPTAPPPRLEPGDVYQMEAAGIDRDGKVVTLSAGTLTWRSSNNTVATVDRVGLVRGQSEGTATITATLGDAKGSRDILVQYFGASVTVQPDANVLDAGETVQLSATVRDADGNVLNHPVTWSSSSPAVATVSPTGLVTALAAGQAGITAQSEATLGLAQITVLEPVVSVQVNPTEVVLSPGAQAQLLATPKDRQGNALNRPVTWTSSNPSVAISDPSGMVTALGLGTATVAADYKGKHGSANVTVQVPVASVTLTSPTHGSEPLEIGLTRQFTAVAKDAGGNTLDRPITWASSDPASASVDATGLVTGVSRGTVTISATSEGQSGTLSLRIVGESTTETANNLSVPAIFAEGIGLSGAPVATETGLRPGPTEGIVVDAHPFFFSGNQADCGGTFFCQGGASVWQAEWADGSALGVQEAEVAFGDNLTHHAYNTHANIHIEVSLTAFAAAQMQGFLMPYSSGTGETEIQGTSGATGLMQPVLYTLTPRLIIEKLDDVTRQPIRLVYEGAIWETFGAESEGSFGTEVNLAGRVSYGYNLMIQNLTFPSDIHKYGWYRITFRLDDAGQVNGAPVARNAALIRLAASAEDEGEAPKFVPQIDPATNTAWVDIEVTSASGGGGGGGEH